MLRPIPVLMSSVASNMRAHKASIGPVSSMRSTNAGDHEKERRGRAYLILAVVCALPWTGCVMLTGTVYEPIPDPLADQFVKVVEISKGLEVIVAGGGRHRVLGILPGHAEQDKELLRRALRNLLVGHPHVLVFESGRAARIVLSQRLLPHKASALILFPTRRQVPPERIDIALYLLDRGWARVNPAEVEEEELRRKYQGIEEDAKRFGRGIWSKEKQQTKRKSNQTNGRGPGGTLKVKKRTPAANP